MMGWSGQLSATGWIIMAVCMLVFWAAVLCMLAMMFRNDRSGGHGRTAPEADPLRVLEVRFARGEIGSDEFVARREELTRSGNSVPTKPEHGRPRV